VVELIHPDSNPRFDIDVVFMANYSFSEGDVPVGSSDASLMTDFINFKIKSAQSFRYIYRDKVYTHVFIGMSAHTLYIYIYIYIIRER
jgi:hypothetical protein